MIRYIFLAVLFLSPHAKAVNYFDLYERAVNDDKEAITILMNHCFDEDTLNKEAGTIIKRTTGGTTDRYGITKDKNTCRFSLIDNWIDFAIADGHAVAYYYKALRTQFDYDDNYLYYLKNSAKLGLEAAYIDLAEYFERHKEFNESGVAYIKKTIEININRNEKNNNKSLYDSLYRTYSFGNIERKNHQEAYNIQKKIREEIYNGKYPDYYYAIKSNFFGMEGKVDYKKSLEFIKDAPVEKKSYDSDNISGIRIIEALHYLYGLGVDKNVEEAFLILTDNYDEYSSVINFLLLLCINDDPSLDIFNNSKKYKNRIFNSFYLYNSQILENENLDRNIEMEKGIISLNFGDYVGADMYLSEVNDEDTNGIGPFIFAMDIINGGYGNLAKTTIRLLEKASFRKHYWAMSELGMLYSGYIKDLPDNKIDMIQGLIDTSIKNNNHFTIPEDISYFNYCSAIYFNNNSFNKDEGEIEKICLKSIEDENFIRFGIGDFSLRRIGYVFNKFHSDINTRLLYSCLGSFPKKEDLNIYNEFNTLKVKLNERLYDLFQNGSLLALDKLFNLNLGNNDCFKGEINKKDAAMYYYAYLILLNAYENVGYVYWNNQEIKERQLSELNLSDIDLDNAKERAKNLMKLVDLNKIN